MVSDINDNSKTFRACNKKRKSPIEHILATYRATVANDGSITFPSYESALDVAIHAAEINVMWKPLNEIGSDHLPCISIVEQSCIPEIHEHERFAIPQLNWNELRKTRSFCRQRVTRINPLKDIPDLLDLVKSIPKTQREFKNPCLWWDARLTQLKRQRDRARQIRIGSPSKPPEISLEGFSGRTGSGISTT